MVSNDRLTARVATVQGQLEVEARDCGVTGLIVTRNGNHDPSTGVWKPSREWQVTHVASGRSVTNHPFERLSDAMACAANLADLADWDRDKDDLLTTPELHKQVHTAVQKVEHDRLGREVAKLRKSIS